MNFVALLIPTELADPIVPIALRQPTVFAAAHADARNTHERISPFDTFEAQHRADPEVILSAA